MPTADPPIVDELPLEAANEGLVREIVERRRAEEEVTRLRSSAAP